MSNEATNELNAATEMVLQLRWSDQDALGHVNNARIVTLMEEARIRWTREDGRTGRFEFGTVVASIQIDYKRPLYYQPEMVIRMGSAGSAISHSPCGVSAIRTASRCSTRPL